MNDIERKNHVKDETKLFLLKNKGGEIVFKGDSMRPIIEEDYRLTVVPKISSSLNVGDIIIFESNGIMVCHRFLKRIKIKDKWHLLEKGDNNLFPSFIQEDCLIGQVKEVYDRKGIALDFQKWKKVPFCTRLYSVLSPFFLIGFMIKNMVNFASP